MYLTHLLNQFVHYGQACSGRLVFIERSSSEQLIAPYGFSLVEKRNGIWTTSWRPKMQDSSPSNWGRGGDADDSVEVGCWGDLYVRPCVFLIDFHSKHIFTLHQLQNFIARGDFFFLFWCQKSLERRKVSVTGSAAVSFPRSEWFPNQKVTNSHAACALVGTVRNTSANVSLCPSPGVISVWGIIYLLLFYLIISFLAGFLFFVFQLKVTWFMVYKSLTELHGNRVQHHSEERMKLG